MPESLPAPRTWWMRCLSLYPDVQEPVKFLSGCDYQGHEFGAAYPDSVCIDGYLWDADSGWAEGEGWTYTVGGELPCPECNRREWLERAKDSWFSDAYDAAAKGWPVFKKGRKGYALTCFLQQLKGLMLFKWDSRPRWSN